MQNAYLNAMSRAANSVTIVTTDGAWGRIGMTVSTLCSVSLEGPAPTLLICLHEAAPTRKAIEINGCFCANLLGEQQQQISDSFAGRAEATGEEKFDCAKWQHGVTGAPVLIGALASFDCRTRDHHKVGSHHIFIGEVQGVESAETGHPLIYHDRQYRRTAQLELT